MGHWEGVEVTKVGRGEQHAPLLTHYLGIEQLRYTFQYFMYNFIGYDTAASSKGTYMYKS